MYDSFLHTECYYTPYFYVMTLSERNRPKKAGLIFKSGRLRSLLIVVVREKFDKFILVHVGSDTFQRILEPLVRIYTEILA